MEALSDHVEGCSEFMTEEEVRWSLKLVSLFSQYAQSVLARRKVGIVDAERLPGVISWLCQESQVVGLIIRYDLDWKQFFLGGGFAFLYRQASDWYRLGRHPPPLYRRRRTHHDDEWD